jgi:hypothetical protein
MTASVKIGTGWATHLRAQVTSNCLVAVAGLPAIAGVPALAGGMIWFIHIDWLNETYSQPDLVPAGTISQ